MVIKIEKSLIKIGGVFLLFIAAFFILTAIIPQDSLASKNINLWAIFLTGLLTGGLTCLAVQGGLLAATIAQREEEDLKEKTRQTGNALPIFAFLVAKLISYTLLGFLLGFFGSLFQLSLTTQIVMQVAVAVFMLGTAFNILNVHPIFRYFVIQPPKSLIRLVRNQSKSKSLFAPVILGAFTIFIPCGTTQAMMALAIGSGSPVLGATVLFAFILGTSPLFFTLGYFATKLGESSHEKFMKVAAGALILLAVFNLNNTLALTGFSFSQAPSQQPSQIQTSTQSPATPTEQGDITIQDNGYNPKIITFKAGSTVKLTITNSGAYTCASAFTIPYFNYQKVVQAGKSETLALKMPDKPTQIPFMCSMGMYRGVINVI